ncbi:MAG: hypothetical protein U0796_04770 [Gemmatales bacterium]
MYAVCSANFSDPDQGIILYGLDDNKAEVVPLDIATMIRNDTKGITRDELFSKAGWTYDDTLSSQACKKYANMELLKHIPKTDIALSITLNRLETAVSYGFIAHGEKKCEVTIPLK